MTVNHIDKVPITRLKRSNCTQLKVRERSTKLLHWTTTISMAALFLLHSLVMEKKTVVNLGGNPPYQTENGVGHCLVGVFLSSLHLRKENEIC